MNQPYASSARIGAGLTLTWGAYSHRGLRRRTNEDSLLADPPVFVVADGMGGHHGGERASATAIDALAALADHARTGILISPEVLGAAIETAARDVGSLDTGDGLSPGTTVSGAVVTTAADGVWWLVFNVGDSRTYRLNGPVLAQISIDHSRAHELQEQGRLAVDAPRIDGVHNVVTRALGAGGKHGRPDIFPLPICDGDRLLICSDGLTCELSDEAIADILRTIEDPQQAAGRLVEHACSAGGRDNVSVLVLDARLDGPGPGQAQHGASESVGDDDTRPVSIVQVRGDEE